jgi:ribosomal protein S18 acetylase RimI-like enzyme
MSLASGSNFVRLAEADIGRRVTDQPSFDPSGLMLALRKEKVVGFVHFGFRTNAWFGLSERQIDYGEGHVYALVAPPGDRSLLETLLERALSALSKEGARRVLLSPSWLHGSQPFYNGIAGAYETPGLDATRREVRELASAWGFSPIAEYGTPELDLADRAHVRELGEQAAALWERAREWGLERYEHPADSAFFPGRRAVELARGRETVATAAYGPWEEYSREYGRRMFGITGVEVAPRWRRRSLGKLVMIMALEAAAGAGAERAHLHVFRQNKPAWELYHRALGFRPTFTWLTLAKGPG